MNTQRQSRIKLILVAAIFVVPVLVAFGLNIAGWRPAGQKNYGELVSPPLLLSTTATADDGSALAWSNPDSKFRFVHRIRGACDAACVERIDHLNGLWRGLGVDATRLEVWFVGDLDAAAREAIARFEVARGVDATIDAEHGAYLVDPNGFLVLRYPPDYDLAGVRKDIARIIR